MFEMRFATLNLILKSNFSFRRRQPMCKPRPSLRCATHPHTLGTAMLRLDSAMRFAFFKKVCFASKLEGRACSSDSADPQGFPA